MYDYSSYSNYGYHPEYASNDGLSALFGFLVGLNFVTWLIIITLSVLTIIGMWKAFSKAGHGGWESLINVHNIVVMFQDAGIKTYWFFLMCLPVAHLIINFWLNIEYAKAFGKSIGFGIGLTLFPFIFFPILGLGSASYVGPANNANSAK